MSKRRGFREAGGIPTARKSRDAEVYLWYLWISTIWPSTLCPMGCFASKPVSNVPRDLVPERATAGPLPVPSPSVPEPSPALAQFPPRDQKEFTRSTHSAYLPTRPRTGSAPMPPTSIDLFSPGLVNKVMSQQSSTSKGRPVSKPTQGKSDAWLGYEHSMTAL